MAKILLYISSRILVGVHLNCILFFIGLVWKSDVCYGSGVFSKITQSKTRQLEPAISWSVPEMIWRNGYPCESHTVRSPEGYMLTMHRITHGKSESRDTRVRPPVLVMHGFLASSDSFLFPGPETPLAFLLADAGYDVWLGNSRGSYYSRNHETLSPKDPAFWDFTWHEMGVVDLPALIDHILATTYQPQLFYVGHSMGCTVYFALTATRPEYNQKIRLMVALAPGVYFGNQETLGGQAFRYGKTIVAAFKNDGQNEFMPRMPISARLGITLCKDGQILQNACASLAYHMFGLGESRQLNKTFLPYYLAHFPSGSSLNTADHFFENQRADSFQWYKSRTGGAVRKYDLSLSSSPVAIFYSQNDGLVAPEGQVRLSKELPNVVSVSLVADPTFNHMDFLTAIDAKQLVYDHVLEIMANY